MLRFIKNSALELIGNTPLVALNRIYKGSGNLLAKAEFMQPGGSVKDRAAKQIIEDAYRSGTLEKGQTVVEMTSGNMGAGLAVACNALGNPLIAVMSEGNSSARVKMLESLGAKVVLVPQVDGKPERVTGSDIQAAERRAIEIAEEKKCFYVDQFNNPSSIRAHEQGTGPEIWNALGGRIDAFVAAVGSGGTFTGTAKFLKAQNPKVICAAVEPEGAQILAEKPLTKSRHLLQGMGYGFVPPKWEAGLADLFFAVGDEEAIHYKKMLAEKEGLHVGFSAAANVCASVKFLKQQFSSTNLTVVTILCDSGLKYQS